MTDRPLYLIASAMFFALGIYMTKLPVLSFWSALADCTWEIIFYIMGWIIFRKGIF